MIKGVSDCGLKGRKARPDLAGARSACAAGQASSSPTQRHRPDALQNARGQEARESAGGPQHFCKAEKAQIAHFISLECEATIITMK